MDLVVGDIVTLASGGPPMTVADLLPWGEVFCVWFTPDRRCVGEVFDLRLVRRAAEPIADTPTAPIVATPLPDADGAPGLAEGTPPLGYESVTAAEAPRLPGNLVALRAPRAASAHGRAVEPSSSRASTERVADEEDTVETGRRDP